jgi:DNA-binding CsgD family transcriptional regulator
MQGEFLGYRALALSQDGRLEEASRAVASIRGTTRAVEASILSVAVDAVISLKRGDTDAPRRIREIETAAFSMGAPDLLVCTYRSVPEILTILLKGGRPGNRLYQLVQDVGDDDLARAAGSPLPNTVRAEEFLSPREREVYELICQGLTNRQIAEILVIEESTVKAHAHHIYDKIGIRSRKDLAVRAALRRQATSATGARTEDANRD